MTPLSFRDRPFTDTMDAIFHTKDAVPTINLPTPPSTAHRDKENRPTVSGGSRVAWSLHNKYHSLAAPLKPRALNIISNTTPSRSILKKPTIELLPLPEVKQREITPEPSDPLINLTYLEYPVSKIVALDASLRDLIEGYNVLAARLRSCVTSSTDADSSWPLFQPIRKHRDALVEAIARDLGRALHDPSGLQSKAKVEEEEESGCSGTPGALLPSPKSTPKKKKGGMSAEQVKYARDVCTISHSVIKLLAAMFTTPAVYRVFTDDQLQVIFRQALEIPLAAELPTPNARKTNALVIWLVQVQRLPTEVLMQLRQSISSALRKGMDGQLGKEGKKGSASDGLKAIHDLCLFQPSTFAPAFIDLLPSILSNLLAPTLALRTQSCHALGGLVLGLTSLPQSQLHTRAARTVANFIMSLDPSPKRQTLSITSSPTKLPTESSIVRTLRTTLNATEPEQAAQGPVWALSVLASFVVLSNSALCNDVKLSRVIYSLLSLAMRHKKSSVRALACIVWRCMAWVYLQPALPPYLDGESEVESDQDTAPGKEQETNPREYYWKVLKSVVELQAGVATIAALLGDEDGGDDAIQRSLTLLKVMMSKGGRTCSDAMETMRQLVGLGTTCSTWSCGSLLSKSLFSSNPGLLTAEFKSLAQVVQPLFDETPGIEDVRPLTREEVSKDWVFEGLLGIWRDALSCLEMFDENEVPSEIVAVWDGLLKANVGLFQDLGDNSAVSEFAIRAVDVLIDILQDGNFVLTPRSVPPSSSTNDVILEESDRPQPVLTGELTNGLLKLRIIRELWMVTRATVPCLQLDFAAERLLACLMKNEDEFVDSSDHARGVWAGLCAEVAAVCDEDALKAFWSFIPAIDDKVWEWSWDAETRSLVWRTFVKTWQVDTETKLEGLVNLLGVPFIRASTSWELSTNDLNVWEDFLTQTVTKALDYGVDSFTILNSVARFILQDSPGMHSAPARVADILVSQLDMAEAREVPTAIFELVSNNMQANYPPKQNCLLPLMWMTRSVTRAITASPGELVQSILELLHDGLCVWITDRQRSWAHSEYIYDIIPLYETCLVAIQSLPASTDTLECLTPLIASAFMEREEPAAAAKEALSDFWHAKYSTMEEPTGGWEPLLRHCLLACGLVSSTTPPEVQEVTKNLGEEQLECSAGAEVVEVLEQNATLVPQTVALCVQGSSPYVGVVRPAFFPSPSVSPIPPTKVSGIRVQPADGPSHLPIFKSSTFDFPSTPQLSSGFILRAWTPTRPEKSPFTSSLSSVADSPASPVPTSLRILQSETPVKALSARQMERSITPRSPFKRRKVTAGLIEDKENNGTNSSTTEAPVLTPLKERAHKGTGKWLKPRSINKKKRPLSTIMEDDEGSDRPMKRSKEVTGHTPLSRACTTGTPVTERDVDADSEDERLVADSLLLPHDAGLTLSTLDTSSASHVESNLTLSSATSPSITKDSHNETTKGDDVSKLSNGSQETEVRPRTRAHGRRRMVLDGVVVPRLREVYGRTIVHRKQARQPTEPISASASAPTTPTRTASSDDTAAPDTTAAAALVSAKIGLKEFTFEFSTPTKPRRVGRFKGGASIGGFPDGSVSRKRRRPKEYDGQNQMDVSGMVEDDYDPFVTVSTPTPTQRNTHSSPASLSPIVALEVIPGSDDSISFPIKGKMVSLSQSQETVVPSSDDDPHLGQVTPHHLISPAIRRIRTTHDIRLGTTNIDPPSDDSIISTSSPTKEIAVRRLKKLGLMGSP